MAHKAQQDFCESVRARFSERFVRAKVLDCGSLDINGSNRWLFTDCDYTGVDVGPGRNVDVVSKIHEFDAADGAYDIVISTECLEHDQYWDRSLQNMIRVLRPGGLLVMTCATTGRGEHGTRRTSPADCPLTHAYGDWGDYYRNLTESDVRTAIDVSRVFSAYEFSGSVSPADLYLWGVKAGAPDQGLTT